MDHKLIIKKLRALAQTSLQIMQGSPKIDPATVTYQTMMTGLSPWEARALLQYIDDLRMQAEKVETANRERDEAVAVLNDKLIENGLYFPVLIKTTDISRQTIEHISETIRFSASMGTWSTQLAARIREIINLHDARIQQLLTGKKP